MPDKLPEMDPSKPFGFLLTHAKLDIEASLDTYPNLDVSDKNTIEEYRFSDDSILRVISEEEIGQMVAHYSVAETNLTHSNLHMRVGALCVIQDKWSDQGSVLDFYEHAAFEDPMPQVRGTAFRLLSKTKEIHKSKFINVIEDMLKRRFSISEVMIPKMLAKLWMESLFDICNDLKYKRYKENFKNRKLEFLADEYLDEMTQSRQASLDQLHGNDPNLRRAAIMLLSEYWNPTEEFFEDCHTIALTDIDSEVRCIAVGCLNNHFKKTKNKRVLQTLAQIVSDVSQPNNLRDISYQKMFQVNDMPVLEWPVTRHAMGNYHFPDDIDWSFVNNFL
ncbi:hypothetical protein [Gimesia aquarii]|uniref:HEAT repeat protein n=1 Tax=Gimesia aquarii TaxID=2527964 RepID=A0A517VXE9_9PLAN|nr:hypothetical protein [Gimesia aquarii]QDT97674.1 hypothetical protein V144x_31540 [Gimesia aquarii]